MRWRRRVDRCGPTSMPKTPVVTRRRAIPASESYAASARTPIILSFSGVIILGPEDHPRQRLPDALPNGDRKAERRSISPHQHRRADVKSHQVFTDHKRPIIGFSCLGDDVVDRGRGNFCVAELENVSEGGEFWL